jgi:hypothetical protein
MIPKDELYIRTRVLLSIRERLRILFGAELVVSTSTPFDEIIGAHGVTQSRVEISSPRKKSIGFSVDDGRRKVTSHMETGAVGQKR